MSAGLVDVARELTRALRKAEEYEWDFPGAVITARKALDEALKRETAEPTAARLRCPACGGDARKCGGCGQPARWLNQLVHGNAIVPDGQGGVRLVAEALHVLEVDGRRIPLSPAAVDLLEVLARAGLSPAEALQRATRGP